MIGAMPEWYVDQQRNKINFSTALPALVPSVDIYRIVVGADDAQFVARDAQLSYLWARAGQAVRAEDKAAAIAAQSTDPVPAVLVEAPTIGQGNVSAPDATATSKGVVQLAGDIGGTAASPTVAGVLRAQNNLTDLASTATARTSLGLGTAATQPVTAFTAAPATPVASSATSGTLTAGAEHTLTPASAATRTLPTGVTSTAITPTTVKNNGTANVTIARGGSDTINGGTASIVVAPGEWARLASDGSGAWTAAGTYGQTATYAHWDGTQLTQGGAPISVGGTAGEAFGAASNVPISPATVSPTIGAEMWALSNFAAGGSLNVSALTPSVTANSTDQTLTTRVNLTAQTSSNVNVDTTYRLAFDYSNTVSGGWAAVWVRVTSGTGTQVAGTGDQYLHTHGVAEKSGRIIFDFKPPAGSTCIEVSLRCWNNATSGILSIANVSLKRTGDVSRPMMVSQQYATGNYPNLYWFLKDAKSDAVKTALLTWTADGALGFAYNGMGAFPTAQPFVGVIPDPTFVTATGTQNNVGLSEQTTATGYSLRAQNNDQVWEVWNGSAFEYRGNTHGGETVRGTPTWRIDNGSGPFSTYTLARSLRTIRRFQVLLPTQIALSTGVAYANVDHTFTCFQDGIIRCDRTTTFLADTLVRQHFEWMSSHDTSTPYLGRIGRGLLVTGEVDTHNKVAAPALTPATSTSGGSLAAATYSYRITAVTPYGESTPSAAVTQATTGTTSTVTLTWSAASNASAYRIYGRSAGVERLLATVGAVTTWTDDGSLGIQPVAPPTVNTGRYYSGTNAMDSEHSTEATWGVWYEPRSGFCYGNIVDRDSVLARPGVARLRARMEMGSGIHKNYFNSEWSGADTATIPTGTVWTSTNWSFVYLPYEVDRFHQEIALRAANFSALAALYPAT